MGADMMHNPFQRLGVVHQLPDGVVAVVRLLHFRVGADGVGDGARLGRHHPRDAIHIPVAHPQPPAHIPQRRLGRHRPEGDDLRHPVAAVAVNHIPQHFIPPVILKVHINVRHFLALKVEETLEHQLVPHRVNVGNAQAVQHYAGRRAAPHPEQYALPPHEGNDVPHHQEVVGETGLPNYFQFILHTRARRLVVHPVPLVEPFPAQPRQVGLRVLPVGRRVAGQMHLPEPQGHFALLRHFPGYIHRLRVFREQRRHLRRRLDIVGRILHPQPLLILHIRPRLDANVHILVLVIRLPHIVGVIGQQQGNPRVPVQLQQPFVDARQLGYMLVMLQFQEVVFAKNLPIPAHLLPRRAVVPVRQQLGHLRRGAPRQADQPLPVLLQQFLVNARLVVKALQIRPRHQL